MSRLAIVKEFFVFLKERKMWWLTPLVLVFIILAALIIFAETSALAPFIYPLF
jgi:hypothetical protein